MSTLRTAIGKMSLLVALACLLPRVAAAVTLQPDSYLDYVPSLGGNVAFGVIYTVFFVAMYAHTFFTGPKVDKWALVLPIGTTFAALGYYLRLPMRTSQHNEPLYTVMYLFVVLSPAAFLAFNYILFGRLTAALEGDLKPGDIRGASRYSFIAPRWVKRIFVTSDVCTFCIQAAGGGMQTSDDYRTANTGNSVFLAGVAAQGASYLLFTALTVVAHIRLIRFHGQRYAPWQLSEPAVRLLALLYLSSAGILVRSVYRIIEMAQGYGGYLYSHEVFTFVLDGLPLVIAVGVWAVYWPGILLRRIRSAPPPSPPSADAEKTTVDTSASSTAHGDSP